MNLMLACLLKPTNLVLKNIPKITLGDNWCQVAATFAYPEISELKLMLECNKSEIQFL